MVRTPTRAMTANLRWTRSGAVWADWILTGLPYGLRPTADKRKVRALHQALFRALPGDSLLLGVRAGLDPAAIVTRMLADVDLQACPDWAAECEATLDWLDRVGPGLRLFWLSVPLAAARPSDRAMEPLRNPPMPDLSDRDILLVSGAMDPIVPAANGKRLAATLDAAGARVELETLPTGHGLSQADLTLARRWFAAR